MTIGCGGKGSAEGLQHLLSYGKKNSLMERKKTMGNGNVIVVGAGASGLAAAIAAAREGSRVTLLEHNDRVGKKILVTGNGKCNLTNEKMGSQYYRSNNMAFVEQVLWAYPTDKILRFFQGLGIVPVNKNGYIYPASGQASAVSDVMRMELEFLGVKVETGVHAEEIVREGEQLIVKTDRGYLKAQQVVLACGSLAGNRTGNDGSGYAMARAMGHHVYDPLPALVQLRSSGRVLKRWAGVRTDGTVSIWVDGNCVARDRGELQLTDYGISGIPVFQVSRYAAEALHEGRHVLARLDFIPDMTRKELYRFLERRSAVSPHKTLEEMMVGFLNNRLAAALMGEAELDRNSRWETLSSAMKNRLCEKMDDFVLPVLATNSFGQAQVCMGGVDTKEVDGNTMESRIMPGVHLAGEMLDVDGICGGYNLHFAWASGLLAGSHAGGSAI